MALNEYGWNYDLTGWSKGTNLQRSIYKMWFSMHFRVNEINKLASCSRLQIEDRWMVFSNFVEDLSELPGWLKYYIREGKGMFLSKDLRKPGNTLYGKDTCSLVPLMESYYMDKNTEKGEE